MKKILVALRTQTIKDSLVVFLGMGITAFLGFVYTVIMARVLKPDVFGVFAAVTSLVAIVYSLGDLGVGPAVISFLPKSKNKQVVINTTFWFQYLVGFLIALGFWLISKKSSIFIPGSTTEHFLLIGSLSFNYILIGWIQSIFTAEKYFTKLSYSQIIDAVIKISLVYYFLRSGNLNISTAISANCVSSVAAILITFWRNLLVIDFSFSKNTFFKIYHYSKWIALSRLFSVFFSRVDIILLNLLASSYAAGIFAAASRVTLLFAMIVSSLGAVINARFASFSDHDQVKVYSKKLFLLIGGIAAALLITVLFAKQIIMIVYGGGFNQSILVFQLLALSMIPFLFSVIFTAALLYTYHQTKFYAYTSLIQFVIILVFDLLFIPKIGVFAPVFASTISNILVFILSATKLLNLFKSDTFDSKKVVF